MQCKYYTNNKSSKDPLILELTAVATCIQTNTNTNIKKP